MLRPLVLALILVSLASAAAAAERIRQFHSETDTAAAEIVAALEAQLPDGPPIMPTREGAMLSYTGHFVPVPLKAFLAAAFPGLEVAALAPGRPVTLSLVLNEADGVTDMSLMVFAAFTRSGAPAMEGATVLLDGTGAAPCKGQMIVSHETGVEETTEAYLDHLESEGFEIAEQDPREMSFFIGQAPGCEIALYVQPDETRTIVVLRYLEE